MRGLSQEAESLNWLISNFVEKVPGVAHTIVVSSDGLLIACSEGLPRDRADQLSAVACGLASLTQGAARIFEGGAVTQTVVEMVRGFLYIMAVSDGSVMATMASTESDMGLIGYEMTTLVERTGEVLTPALREELQNSLAPVN
jgi:predicted regulator of Ras-like GTPase activity (Roadblock/LC7/MglB family)